MYRTVRKTKAHAHENELRMQRSTSMPGNNLDPITDSSKLSEEEIYKILASKNYEQVKESYRRADNALRSDKFDVNFSGTTAVSVIVINNRLICANSGDSRAIIACECLEANEKKVLSCIPLSRDHKPELEDEYERIVKSGGAVHQFVDNGHSIGPNRVWVKNESFPGLAMSRSIGDHIASSVGVTCEPGKFEK